jgi:hypothetical protein
MKIITLFYHHQSKQAMAYAPYPATPKRRNSYQLHSWASQFVAWFLVMLMTITARWMLPDKDPR